MKIDTLDPKQLDAFAAVMTVGSITGAARALSRSQSVVTRQIQDLETSVGFSLFDRNGPRIAPTDRGNQLYEEVQRFLGSIAMLQERIGAIRDGAPPAIDIASTPALAVSLVPRVLADLEVASLPRNIHIQSNSAEQVARHVLGGMADIGLTSLPVEHPELTVHWMAEAQCMVLLRDDDPLAHLKRIKLSGLTERRIITLANPYRLQARIGQALLEAGISSEASLSCNSSQIGASLVHAGLGLAITEPATAFGALPAGLTARPLDVRIPYFFGVITSSARPVPPTALTLIEGLRHKAENLIPDLTFISLAEENNASTT